MWRTGGMKWSLALFTVLHCLKAAVLPPHWADPNKNPCATKKGGWQLLYWPQDGKCYKIFSQGPCPETMEFSPKADGMGHCTCPPNTARSSMDALCHTLFTRGPCPVGEYFSPVPLFHTHLPSLFMHWGKCRQLEQCYKHNYVWWPKDEKCYSLLKKGPCPYGKLLVKGRDGLPTCHCDEKGELSKHHWPATKSCYQHYTRGPCTQNGLIFLPNGKCGCNANLLQYHKETGLCYPLGEQGPCKEDQRFVSNGTHTTCKCKRKYIYWPENGLCYLQYTQGPCPKSQILYDTPKCQLEPCRGDRLFFPEQKSCYKVGTQGPCPSGQIVVFHIIKGIPLHKGLCGCPGPGPCQPEKNENCDIMFEGVCYKLYEQGPCKQGQWLTPSGQCECKPNYRNSTTNGSVFCEPPTVILARFLNGDTYIQ